MYFPAGETCSSGRTCNTAARTPGGLRCSCGRADRPVGTKAKGKAEVRDRGGLSGIGARVGHKWAPRRRWGKAARGGRDRRPCGRQGRCRRVRQTEQLQQGGLPAGEEGIANFPVDPDTPLGDDGLRRPGAKVSLAWRDSRHAGKAPSAATAAERAVEKALRRAVGRQRTLPGRGRGHGGPPIRGAEGQRPACPAQKDRAHKKRWERIHAERPRAAARAARSSSNCNLAE